MRVEVFSGKLSKLQTSLLIVTCFKDIRPLKALAAQIDWYYGGLLSRVMMEERFSGEAGETLLLASGGKLQIPKVLLMGLGLSTTYDFPRFKTTSSILYPILKNLNIRDFAIEVSAPSGQDLDTLQLVNAFLNGDSASDLKDELEVTFIVKEGEKAIVQQQYIHHYAPSKK